MIMRKWWENDNEKITMRKWQWENDNDNEKMIMTMGKW
jgi:hypothetical protein